MKGFEKNLEKVQKTFEKVLDKSKSLWYNIKVAERRLTARPKPLEKNFEKSQKTFEKVLDKRKGLWYNI